MFELSIIEHTVLILLPFIHRSIQSVMYVCKRGSVSHVHNPVIIFGTERNVQTLGFKKLFCISIVHENDDS
jgi:hypothetical protein